MSKHMPGEVLAMFSADRQFYVVPEAKRDGPLIWLATNKRPLPVPPEWRRPDSVCAFVMRGRDYYRFGLFGPLQMGISEMRPAGDDLIIDYLDAVWWTPGLEETWVELDGMKEAVAEATKLHVCESSKPEATLVSHPEPPCHPERSEGSTRSDSPVEVKAKRGKHESER
jgi:hypothetical protein